MAVFRLTTTDRSLREAVAVDAPSSDVIVGYGVRPTVRLFGQGGSGRAVQYTTSPEAMILAGTAIWEDWPLGVVSIDTIDLVAGAITGLRLTQPGGAMTWEVVV